MPNYSDIWEHMDYGLARMKGLKVNWPISPETAFHYFKDCSDEFFLDGRTDFLNDYEKQLWEIEYHRRFLLRPADPPDNLLRPAKGPGEDKDLLKPIE